MRWLNGLALCAVLGLPAWAQHEGHGGGQEPPPLSPAARRAQEDQYRRARLERLQGWIDEADEALGKPGLPPKKRAKLERKLARLLAEKDEMLEAESPAPGGPDAVRALAARYIAYYKSIALTPGQEKVKTEALETIPAPCCKEYSIATCCCPCNLAKSVWGLSHYLIAQRGQGAGEVRKAAREWLRTANPSGYAGDACGEGRCALPFHEDGCAGMDERKVR
jgi:hypothetical protein